jgi:alpha,alpha-trehalose phosphorylase
MIRQAAYGTEPWRLVERELDLDVLAQSESIFALSNGHIGLRGNLDEGDPNGLPGTYLNSFYEVRPLPYAEAGYGFPDNGQTVINVTNGKIIRLLVDDEPFDIRYGTLHSHERILDMRAGTLTRRVEWSSPAGARVKVTSVRMVSLTQRAVAAISYTVEPTDATLRLVLQSGLVANEELPPGGKDPRLSAILQSPLVSEEHQLFDGEQARVALVHKTRVSGLRMAAAMSHEISGPERMRIGTESYPDQGRTSVAAQVSPGETLHVVKYLAYGWSSQRTRPALIDQVLGALAAARLTGWDGLLAEQRAYLDEFWDGADVEVEGDAEIQQAVRFGLFHILQAGARAEFRPIPAKGLTGTGYDGHTFWDTESFVLPVLTYTWPQAARDALTWRYMVLPEAKQHAVDLGLAGSAFPWRTIRGQETSGYWPAGTAAFHINADIADAVLRYLDATEDAAFEKEAGLELLVETARLWRSLGQHNSAGRFRIDGVTGPDEYSAIKDNNVYTNLMAQRNLAFAADLVEKMPEVASNLGVTTEEAASWRDAATAMYIPFDERLGVHPQHEGFTDYAMWDFADTPPDHYPLLLHYPYFQLYRKQVVKQADLVLAMHMRPDAFTAEQKARNFAYYEPLTVRDSSLSACTQSVMAAEVGQLDLARDYLAEAALMDLADVEHNTSDGVHMASLAGAWLALVQGFGGMRAGAGALSFSPCLPPGITRLRFRLRYRGRKLRVTIVAARATYELMDGEPLQISHHGQSFLLGAKSAERAIPRVTAGPRPLQPPGRAPYRVQQDLSVRLFLRNGSFYATALRARCHGPPPCVGPVAIRSACAGGPA